MNGRILQRNRLMIRVIDPLSTNPSLTKCNPSILLQARSPQPAVQILMPPACDTDAASTIRPDRTNTDSRMSQDHPVIHRPSTSPSLSSQVPVALPRTPSSLPSPSSPGPVASPRSPQVTPGSGGRRTPSDVSQGSTGGSVVHVSGSSSSAESDGVGSPEMFTPETQTSSDDDSEAPPTSTTPGVTTRGGRQVRPLKRYSPSDYK
jgi:hypothetical protein